MYTPTILKFSHYLPTCLWRWNRHSVPKRRDIKLRRRGITQNKTYKILNMCFLRRGVVSTSLNHQTGGPPLVGCPRLLIQFIHSYPPYRRPFGGEYPAVYTGMPSFHDLNKPSFTLTVPWTSYILCTLSNYYHTVHEKLGARGGAVGWGTALQAGRSRVRFPMVSLELFIDIILPAALWPWGTLSL